MPGRRINSSLSLALTFIVVGCGEAETRPPPSGTTTITKTSGPGGQGGDGGNGADGGGGQGGGGQGGGTGGNLCGNGSVDNNEDCDGADLNGKSCGTLGFSGGMLTCGPQCALDISMCVGSDVCTDGIDNDGDLLIDCDEPDCKDACENPCFAPVLLPDGGDVIGSNIKHANVIAPSCGGESGGEIAYQVKVTGFTGMLDILLIEDGSAALSLSARTDCGPTAPELGCLATYTSAMNLTKKLSVPVTIGQTVFAFVDGIGAGTAGGYTLVAQSRPIECGDGITDPNEGCDDANITGGDGCSATCMLESSEQEPNNSLASANPFVAPWVAEINPALDVDYVSVSVANTASIRTRVWGLVPEACNDGMMDSYVTIFDSNGIALAQNDDAPGLGSCSTAVVPNVAPGTYYVAVAAAPLATNEAATFPYTLTVDAFECGDGTKDPGEECDDGNGTSNDGCSPSCTLDVDETEPNGTLVTANAYTSGFIGRIDPDDDIDVVTLTLTKTSKVTIVTSDPTFGNGCNSTTDTFIELIDANGNTIAENDDAVNYCAALVANNVPAGKVYVRVQATKTLGMSFVYIFPYGLDILVE